MHGSQTVAQVIIKPIKVLFYSDLFPLVENNIWSHIYKSSNKLITCDELNWDVQLKKQDEWFQMETISNKKGLFLKECISPATFYTWF